MKSVFMFFLEWTLLDVEARFCLQQFKRFKKCIEENQKDASCNIAGTILILRYAKKSLLYIQRFTKCIEEYQKGALSKTTGGSKRCLL